MFTHRMDKRRTATTTKPIKIFLFINEEEDEENDPQGGNVASTAEDEDDDEVGDKITFNVIYGSK